MIYNTPLNKFFQPKNRNLSAFRKLIKIGFPISNVRKALVLLNGLKLHEIAGQEMTIANVSKSLAGRVNSRSAEQLISERLGISRNELFPKKGPT